MIVVQVGTNTGSDHVLRFCKNQSCDQIFLIEPFAIHNVSIDSHYKGIPNYKVDNVAIVPNSVDSVQLYYTENDGPSGHPNKSYEVASIKPEHLIKHDYTYDSLLSVTVPAFTMNEYLTNNKIHRVDYLFLDIEGIDFEVLQTIDFDKFDIKNLQIEHLHLDKNLLFQFMKSKGYSPRKGIDFYGYDTMFVKQ